MRCVRKELERTHACDEDGDAEHVEQGDAKLPVAVDDVVAVDDELVGTPGASRDP
jgi:hypothetical protein